MERKLAAIFHADVKGYSRLIGEDEVTTLRTVASHLVIMRTLVGQHGGRAVGSRGDSLLAEFPSAVEAVQCAVEMQRELRVKNAEFPADRRVEFRIGINLGEVVVEGEEIYGDGVNIAVRLEGLAEAGGICISEVVYDQVRNRLVLVYEDLGEQTLKNIEKPVRVWRVQLEESGGPESGVRSPGSKGESQKDRRVGIAHRRWAVGAVAGLVLLAGTVVVARYLTRPPLSTQDSALLTQEAPALPLPDKPSLVVLAFTNLSGDPGQEYFSDGITEDLTTALAKISGLFVIARNSAFVYKGKPVDVKAVSRELGVRYVVEGSVRKADSRVRITAQLVDGLSASHVWAESYDRELKDLFAVQDEVRQKIVFALKVKLTQEEQERFRRAPTDNLEAYDFFLRGVESDYRFTKEANLQAQQMLERALALDPQYAGAYAWLGWTYSNDWIFHWSQDSQQSLERAFELAQRAIALDDSQPDAHQVLSFIYLWGKKQPEQALAEAERGLALDPNYADGYANLAEVLSLVGRSEEAIGVAQKALRLNPRGPVWYLHELGQAYFLAGQVEEAIATSKQVLTRDPNFLPAYTNLAFSYVLQWAWQLSQDPQTLEQAFALAQQAIALNDSFPWAHTTLGAVYLWQKQYDQALAEAERAIALDPNVADGYALLANILNVAGKPEEAIEMAEKAIRFGSLNPDWYLFDLGHAYCVTGRYEEAITTLKKFIIRNPNILHAQLFLAFASSEAGREEEARAAAAEVLRISPKFSLEVMRQRWPYKDPAVLERQLAALRKAGLK